VFLGSIGHCGCHVVRVPASVGDQLLRQNPTTNLLHCIQEFANDNRAVNTMYGFPTKSVRSKDSKGMYGLCTSTDNIGNMFTDRQVATDCNA